MSNAISILNDLIETSKDGEKGFRTSAEDTRTGSSNPSLWHVRRTALKRLPICSNS